MRSNKPIESLPEELLLDLEKHGIMELDESPKPKYPNVRPVIHVLFDDIQGTEIMRPNSPLINLCIRHRHVGGGLGCSVWLLVQSYISTSSVPRCVRENAILLLLWAVRDEKLRIQIAHEATGCSMSPDEFLKAFDFATDDESGHSFLMVDYTAPRGKQFRKNLDQLISLHIVNEPRAT